MPKEEEAAFDAMIKSHQQFMSKTHSIGTGGAAPALLEYSWAKGEALNDPMDPEQGTTGQLWYALAEVYTSPEDIPAHMEAGQAQWDDFPTLMDFNGKYAKHIDVGSQVITCMSDGELGACTSGLGHPSINIAYKVPADKEAEFDALLKDHEANLMRKSHTFDAMPADDATKPRLSQFYMSKMKEQVDPLDASKGETGDFLYVMNESYIVPAGIAGHMAVATSTWPKMDEFMAFTSGSACWMQVGACKVVATMAGAA